MTASPESADRDSFSTRELLDLYLKGDHASEAELFQRHQKRLVARIRSQRAFRALRSRFSPEDVASEVFLRTLSSGLLKRFIDHGAGSLQNALNDIAEKVLVDMHRRLGTRSRGDNRPHEPFDASEGEASATQPATPDTSPTQRARGSELHALCERVLTDRERAVWKLVIDQGLDPAEVARRLGIEPSSVRSLLRNARSRLQEWLRRSQD